MYGYTELILQICKCGSAHFTFKSRDRLTKQNATVQRVSASDWKCHRMPEPVFILNIHS